ncbi:MAG TPA: acyl-CoA carboxylase epsilon subunit [Segeticoccus sp.]|uniref:acyl-CoA carboxylase epsilon subunit n=1 Tax=Segeticoccus sp. TaxID=2706531 RepID=UPI002D7F14F2|nr:acyl-CoA carboxylase epsilon subunit [Segeticoccus sp.]HET8602103.1 acyl-CoA carboxylase epsilon subunit [Segeticoccus sp.]
MTDDDPTPTTPQLRIVRGAPSAEELAALVTVLAAAGAGAHESPRQASRWAARDRLVGAAPGHGPGQWRASALPR